MGPVRVLLLLIRGVFRDRAELAAENLALRQQLAALQHRFKRPRLRKRDRIFWAILSQIWPNWRSALLIIQPDTVIRWHRSGFKLFWRWKSRTDKPGRPRTAAENATPQCRLAVVRASRDTRLTQLVVMAGPMVRTRVIPCSRARNRGRESLGCH